MRKFAKDRRAASAQQGNNQRRDIAKAVRPNQRIRLGEIEADRDNPAQSTTSDEEIVFKSAFLVASTWKRVAGGTIPRPAELPASRLFLSAAILAALAALALTIDLPVARMFQTGHIPRDLHHLVRLGETFGWGGTVALIILAAAALDNRGWRVIPRLATAAFGAGLLANCIKLLVARQRPADMDLHLSVGQTFIGWRTELATGGLSRIQIDALNSFPSGHTATATGLAVALSVLYPRGRWLFAFLAALAAFQRLEFRAHYLSDVLAGAALGCLVGAICQLDFGVGHWLAKIERYEPAPAPARN